MSGPVEILRRLRNDQTDDAETTAALAKSLIESGKISSAGAESWDVYEQAAVAFMEIGEDALAATCINRLAAKFPDSARVHALKGLQLEAAEHVEDALGFYDKVLAVEPTNVPVMKRRVTALRSTGRLGEAITQMSFYLDHYHQDPHAWSELGAMYETLKQYDFASFCYSECLLQEPYGHKAHAQYAGSLYMQFFNSFDLIYSSLRHYLRSLELREDYVRALCGVKVCTRALLDVDRDAMRQQQGKVVPAVIPIEEEQVKRLDLMATVALQRIKREGTNPGLQEKGAIELIEQLCLPSPRAVY